MEPVPTPPGRPSVAEVLLPTDRDDLDANVTRSEAGLPSAPSAHSPADPRVLPGRFIDLPGGRTPAYAETGSGPDLVAVHVTLMTLEEPWLGPGPVMTADGTLLDAYMAENKNAVETESRSAALPPRKR